MKIGFLGTGAWGYCLARLLSGKGHKVTSWSIDANQIELLKKTDTQISFTENLEEALEDAEMIVESVTSKGIRPVFEQIKKIKIPECPMVITSKGIEQNTGLILPDILLEIFGEKSKDKIAIISGPSFADDVIRGLPVSVVGASFFRETMINVCDLFTTETFRVYPNADIVGVSYGGALKNIIAIACGISGGLSLGDSCNAALITRGLHEISKLAVGCGSKPETLYGLSGMGDLCLTCGSILSRNYRFGSLLAQGNSPEEAKNKIGMVVEGAYTCLSALQIGKKLGISMPITETVYKIIYENFKAADAVSLLMKRTIKEEHL